MFIVFSCVTDSVGHLNLSSLFILWLRIYTLLLLFLIERDTYPGSYDILTISDVNHWVSEIYLKWIYKEQYAGLVVAMLHVTDNWSWAIILFVFTNEFMNYLGEDA